MCARFSVSRTALREAYSILSAKGLIVARPKIGTRVRPKAEWNLLDPEVLAWHLAATPSEHLVDELFALRQMVEPPAAAMAASAPSRDTVGRIADAYGRMERLKVGAGDLIGADLDFHMAILEASGTDFWRRSADSSTRRSSAPSVSAGAAPPACRTTACSASLGVRGDPRRRCGARAPAHGRTLADSIGDVREYLRQRDEAMRPASTR